MRIVRPNKAARGRPEVECKDQYDPFFCFYYGFDDFDFYSWLWSEMCYEHHIHCCDCTLIDEYGLSEKKASMQVATTP